MKIETHQKAFLVGAYFATADKELTLSQLEELAKLCETFGLVPVGEIACPLKKRDAGVYLGKGKIDELLELVQEREAEMLIFDEELSPNQQRNLEKIFKKPVIDRTELILAIFAQKAQTREAKLQIELAKIRYEAPRLKRLWTHLSREAGTGGGGGGGYLRGMGEQQIEIDKRLLKKRIEQLKVELEEVEANRKVQRTQREKLGIPTFAIIGYTNAGKSTLLRTLTSADVLIEDKLFATLDTKARKFTLPNNQEILLIDTVGFIRKIPHTLVAAFRSTLEEALHTDILLHLIDASHPQAELQAKAALSVLEELGAKGRPIITVLNKADQAPHLWRLKTVYPGSVAISALTGAGIPELMSAMIEALSTLRVVMKLRIPQAEYALVSELRREGKVVQCDYEENDILLEIEVPRKLEHKYSPYRS